MLDPRAITLSVLIVTCTLAAVLGHLARTARDPKAVMAWSAGLASTGISAFLNVAQEDIHAWLSMVVALPLMFMGIGLMLAGMRRIQGQPPRHSTYLWPAAVMLVVAIEWGWIHPEFMVRVQVYSALMAYLLLHLAWSVRPLLAGPMRAGALSVGIPALVFALLFIVRVPAIHMYPARSVLEPSMVNSLTYLLGGAFYMALGTGLLLMTQLLLVRELIDSAGHDSLTGLLNRRGMKSALATGIGGYAVLSIDMDHFKQLNDGSGHQTGDRVLAWMGAALRQCVRQGSDHACRMGGEEFAVFVRGRSASEMLGMAERLRLRLARESQHATGHLCTVSVGVAVAMPGEQLDTLLQRADGAMYQAKRQGRNRCVLATDSAPDDPHALTRDIPVAQGGQA